MLKRQPIRERFFSKVSLEDERGCWLWLGPTGRGDYGMFFAGGDRHNVLAHRWAYEQFVGEIPSGLLVLHHCDEPKCVNPQHLWLGTQADNVQDCIAKGRRAKTLTAEHRRKIGEGNRRSTRQASQ